MAFVICPPCIEFDHAVCERACMEVCPVQCIYLPDQTVLPQEARQDMLYVHPYECVHCGACVPVCPAAAIFAEDEVPAPWREYLEVQVAAFDTGGIPQIPPCPYGLACPYPRWKRVARKKGKEGRAECPAAAGRAGGER